MKLAYSSNAYMKFSVTDAISRIGKLGYGAMELMADTPHAWPATTTDEQLHGIRRALNENGIAISNINAFMMNAVQDFWHPSWIEADASFRRLRIQHTMDALTMAKKLGAPCITTEPGGPLEGGQSRDQALDTFVIGLCEALRYAEDVGVCLLVEPEPGLLIENTAQFLELAARIDSPMFGLNFDVGHFYCVGDSLEDSVEALQSLTRHYHLEDIAATRVHEHLIPGDGAIDFTSVLRAIGATGYDGWLTVELYPFLDDPDLAGERARDHLSPLLGAV